MMHEVFPTVVSRNIDLSGAVIHGWEEVAKSPNLVQEPGPLQPSFLLTSARPSRGTVSVRFKKVNAGDMIAWDLLDLRKALLWVACIELAGVNYGCYEKLVRRM